MPKRARTTSGLHLVAEYKAQSPWCKQPSERSARRLAFSSARSASCTSKSFTVRKQDTASSGFKPPYSAELYRLKLLRQRPSTSWPRVGTAKPSCSHYKSFQRSSRNATGKIAARASAPGYSILAYARWTFGSQSCAVWPNPSFKPTRYGRQRKPGPRHMVHHRVPGLRGVMTSHVMDLEAAGVQNRHLQLPAKTGHAF